MTIAWTLFDLNGTLLDPSAIARPLGGGKEEHRLVREAFGEALLLTMADMLSGAPYRPLPDYLAGTLEHRLRAARRDTEPLDEAMAGAAAMDPFPEADAALGLLERGGVRLGVLTNSSTGAAEASLEHAGLRQRFELVLGSDEVEVFKPHPRVYLNAAERLGIAPPGICLVAAHAWDVMGAMRSGMRGAWVARAEAWLVPTIPEPDVRGEDLEDTARRIIERLIEAREAPP